MCIIPYEFMRRHNDAVWARSDCLFFLRGCCPALFLVCTLNELKRTPFGGFLLSGQAQAVAVIECVAYRRERDWPQVHNIDTYYYMIRVYIVGIDWIADNNGRSFCIQTTPVLAEHRRIETIRNNNEKPKNEVGKKNECKSLSSAYGLCKLFENRIFYSVSKHSHLLTLEKLGN